MLFNASTSSSIPSQSIEKCVICQESLTQNVVNLSGCSHTFHKDCIDSWKNITNQCPICRKRFTYIQQGHLQYKVEAKEQKNTDQLTDQYLNVLANEPCRICNSTDLADRALLCDECDGCFHTHCLGLDEIPQGDWYCDTCKHLKPDYVSPFSSRRSRRNDRNNRYRMDNMISHRENNPVWLHTQDGDYVPEEDDDDEDYDLSSENDEENAELKEGEFDVNENNANHNTKRTRKRKRSDHNESENILDTRQHKRRKTTKQTLPKDTKRGWTCKLCTFKNDSKSKECVMCEAQRDAVVEKDKGNGLSVNDYFSTTNNNNNKKKKLTLHEHSTITSITQSQNEDICDVVSRVDMNWERIGQILLDHRFLDTARLINQALDHLETFCNDEDVDENAWRDEICRAWSVTDDRGILLWQILYGNLKYSADERRWFYDLMLRFYFKLNDMKTANIVFLCTKILRDMKQPIDLVQMKEILAVNKVDGFSFNAEIKTAKGFADLFCTMQNVSSSVWHKLYYGLTQWNPDDAIRNKHADHQKKYKNKVIDDGNHVRGASAAAEITIFPDITRVSIRDGIDYSNSAEKKEWVAYRHNIKNVFIAFAGYHASQMTHGEFERLLSIFDIGQFCSMHLMQQDVITMDEFIKWLCSEYINDAARDIRKHIEKLPQWTLFVNALSFLDQLEEDAQGILQYKHFQRFAINLSLNDIESKILFDKICANTSASYGPGCIHMNHVFEWLKKHCMQRLIKATKTTKKEIKKTTL
eukprot:1121515_1